MRVLLAFFLLLGAQAFGGENSNKPADPAKELFKFASHICAYLPGEMERNACYFDLKDFMKANSAPCAAKEMAVAKLRLASALCEEPHKKKDKATGQKVDKIEPKHGSACWHVFVRKVAGKDPKPFVEGQSYDLSKMSEAVAWAGAACVGKDRYHDIDVDCMHERIQALETMFSVGGINEGPSPATYACAEGASSPVLAEGQDAAPKVDVQPRIVTTAAVPGGAGAQVVK